MDSALETIMAKLLEVESAIQKQQSIITGLSSEVASILSDFRKGSGEKPQRSPRPSLRSSIGGSLLSEHHDLYQHVQFSGMV